MIRSEAAGRHAIPARLNLGIAASQLAAIFGCIYLAGRAAGWWQLGLLALAFGVLMNSVYAVIHEAYHGMLLPDRRFNDALGVLMALFFPAPFHLLRQGHIGHHLRNRSDDEAFDYYFEGESPVWKVLQLYGTMTGFFWLTIVLGNLVVLVAPGALRRENFSFDRPSAAFMDALNPRYSGLIRLEAALVVATHALILWVSGVPPWRYAVMYFGFGFTWSAMQYVHHYGTERHVLRGARNLWLWAPIDRLWLHHNWHLTHHKHPTVPWVHLPELGRREDPRRGFLPAAYLRMWRGPRRAREHVENRYAGRVIR